MSKAYTRATRMAATFLAKQSGADAAATAFGVDPRTIRSWMGTVEIPEDQWTAIRDVLLARGAEMAATGKTSGLAAILTGAGISERNVRYGELIARREARRDGVDDEPLPARRRKAWHLFRYPNSGPERVPVNDGDETHLHRYLDCAAAAIRDELRHTIASRGDEDEPPEPPAIPEEQERGDAGLLHLGIYAQWRRIADESEEDMSNVVEWLQTWTEFAGVTTAEMSDEEYTVFLAKLRSMCIAKANEWWPSYSEVQERRFPQARPAAEPAVEAPAPPDPADEPVRPPLRPVEPVSDGPDTWQPMYRSDL